MRASVMCSTAAMKRSSRVGKWCWAAPLDTPARSATTLTVLPDQPTSAKQPTAAPNKARRVARLRSCFGPFGVRRRFGVGHAANPATAPSGSSVAIVTSPMRPASAASKRSPVR